MPPAKSAGNVTVTYNSNAITAYLSQQSLNAVVGAIDVTNLASAANVQIAGLATWTQTLGGAWDSTLDGIIGPYVVAPPATLHTLAVVIGPAAAQATYTWTANSFFSDYTINTGSPSDAITWSGTLTLSGAPVRS